MITFDRSLAAWITVLPVLLMILFLGRSAFADTVPASSPDPRISIHNGFVDETACASCHQDQAAAFKRSHHANAMALANDSTVRGDFNNVRYEHDGIVTTFHRRDARFFVKTEGSDGKETEFEVRYTFAYEPLQQYLVETGAGRLQALDVAWDTTGKQWFWLGNDTPRKPGSTYHWTGPFYRWNRTCIDCHSTDPQANFQPATNEYKSTYVATSIGCQSCHGPGAKHVAWAAKGQDHPGDQADPGLSRVDANACLACHSRRVRLRDGYEPGKPFLDYFSPALLRSDLYFPDGQIRDEVFEYGSFQQSKMAAAGVTCLDCHRPHEAGLKAEGNALCTQCHTQTKLDRFVKQDPSGLFDDPSHTHHPVGSAGAQCANCHMPERTYMKVDPRRDHSFVIPRPDLSMTFSTPNACTTCHTDKDDDWAARTMDRWYDFGWRNRPTITHAFAALENRTEAAEQALRKLVNDRNQPGIIRGSAITRLSQIAGEDVTADIHAASSDPDPLVRLGASEAASNIPPERRLDAIGDLLGDEMRAVRIAAATALGNTPAEVFGSQRPGFEAAVEDLRSYVSSNADFAETQSNYGFFLFGQHRIPEAEGYFKRAISLDPTLEGVHVNLAEFYRAIGQNDKAEQAYAEAISVSPERAELRFGHGLALVRSKRLDDAIVELEQAVRLDPRSPRYKTTLTVALDSIGKTQEALNRLDHWASETSDPAISGLALEYSLKLQLLPQALKFAEQLARLRPQDQRISDLIRRLREATTNPN